MEPTVIPSEPFVDIHCHLLPGIDDGSASWEESLAMAQQMVDNGTSIAIVTPHQLGNYSHNRGDVIRHRTAQLQGWLSCNQVPLRVLPGADVRIDSDMLERLSSGDCLSLGDHRRHVLLELPHELYMPVEPVLEQLQRLRLVGILSHPERNRGILRQPEVIEPLIEAGCLMQVTADSLVGEFGDEPRNLAEQIVAAGHCHFLATDAHGAKKRPPRMLRAYQRAVELVGDEVAVAMCCRNPLAVAEDRDVEELPSIRKPGWMSRFFTAVSGRAAA
ncbi:MAG: CpsB/CapC family capsule biosynthesis tyrosine phosphatase [Pirellulaceae bacterium]